MNIFDTIFVILLLFTLHTQILSCPGSEKKKKNGDLISWGSADSLDPDPWLQGPVKNQWHQQQNVPNQWSQKQPGPNQWHQQQPGPNQWQQQQNIQNQWPQKQNVPNQWPQKQPGPNQWAQQKGQKQWSLGHPGQA